MISTVIQLLGSALSLWDHKEKRKYMDKYMMLQRRYYEELNSPDVDDAALDNLEFELRVLSNAVSAEIASKNLTNK